jgi:hypothetical protein
MLRRPEEIAKLRGIPEEEFVPKGLLRAYREGSHGAYKTDVPEEVA